MKKILILYKIIFLITYVNVYAHAEISTPSPTTALNKIAKSMSSSVKNDVQSIQKNSNTTSNLINSSELTAGIQESAAKYGLAIDSDAASVLASIDTSSSDSISTALASLDANIGWLDDDYVQTVDQDTIVYDSEWQTLTKVTGGDLEYTTDENVFDPTKSQQMRAKVYVNFKKRTIFADVFSKLNRKSGAGGRNSSGGTEIETSWSTGAASFNSLPIVATEDQRIGDGWGSHSVPFGTNIDASSTFSTMKKTTTTLQDACAVSSCGEGNYWTNKQNFIEEFNNNVEDTSSYGSVYMYGKFTTASEGSEGVGILVYEAGFTADGANEQTFVESIERYEATATLVGKAAE